MITYPITTASFQHPNAIYNTGRRMMTQSSKIARESASLARTLRSTRMEADAYKIAPQTGMNPFLLTATSRKPLRIWKGLADVELHPDRQHRQAVVTAHEDKRVLREEVIGSVQIGTTSYALPKDFDPHEYHEPWLRERVRDQALVQSRLTVPSGTRRTVTSFTITDFETVDGIVPSVLRDRAEGKALYRWYFTAKLTHTTPASESNFLVGVDEIAQFICVLPEKADSVSDAHDLLRPSRVPEGSPRQGEWFFVPVSKTLASALDRQNASYTYTPWAVLEPGSTHSAMVLSLGLRRFTRGYVRDTRLRRHRPLWLSDWHEIIRNREIRVATRPEARYYD